jgi:uncharacterized PurR-regulated membrane protein YhhQ (DUF165 family)
MLDKYFLLLDTLVFFWIHFPGKYLPFTPSTTPSGMMIKVHYIRGTVTVQYVCEAVAVQSYNCVRIH